MQHNFFGIPDSQSSLEPDEHSRDSLVKKEDTDLDDRCSINFRKLSLSVSVFIPFLISWLAVKFLFFNTLNRLGIAVIVNNHEFLIVYVVT